MNELCHACMDNPDFEIQHHPTWFGNISGLKAEKMLRGKQIGTYLLRAGEHIGLNETDYYVTFVLPDYSIRHQPFVITMTPQGWFYENTSSGGPFINTSIDEVLHLMMHCEKEETKPFINFEKKCP